MQELKKKQIEQQRKHAAKDVRLSAYTAEADLKVSRDEPHALSSCCRIVWSRRFHFLLRSNNAGIIVSSRYPG